MTIIAMSMLMVMTWMMMTTMMMMAMKIYVDNHHRVSEVSGKQLHESDHDDDE